jgi:hypothetical protein
LSDSETHHSIRTRSPMGFARWPNGIQIVGCNKLKRIAPTLDTLSQAPVQCPLVIAPYAGLALCLGVMSGLSFFSGS